MAAYLVGTRGTPIHAVGLGLSVTVSHTLGILVLAALVVGAQGLLAAGRRRPRGAGRSPRSRSSGIGGWMLVAEVRSVDAARQAAAAHASAHDHATTHDHEHEHEHDHARPRSRRTTTGPRCHRHGGVAHSHLPPDGSTLSWRGLFALGLAGGLIPSTSALFILLGSIVAGRPAFGFVLVVVFGLGMAAVMTGVGLAMVLARGRLDRVPSSSGLGRAGAAAPLVAVGRRPVVRRLPDVARRSLGHAGRSDRRATPQRRRRMSIRHSTDTPFATPLLPSPSRCAT